MDQQEAIDLVYEIDEYGKNINNWEADFLDSMMKQLDFKGPTIPQSEVILEIYKKVFEDL